MTKTIRQISLYLAWLVSVVGFIGALYASEIQHMPVCNLCWYQRICLFPLVIILGIAAYYDDRKIVKYVLPLTILGFIFALYQYLIQLFPGFAPIEVCGLGPSCTHVSFIWLGFITFPLLSLIGFLIITLLLIIAGIKK